MLEPLEEALQRHDHEVAFHPAPPERGDPLSSVMLWFLNRSPGILTDAPGFQAITRLRRMDRKLREEVIAKALTIWALTHNPYLYMEALTKGQAA